MEKARHFTPITSSLRWQTLRPMVSGCQGDYITATTDSRSLRMPKVAKEAEMEILETGLPVMYFNPKSKSFENRVVKVDKQLSFFFVLEERTLKDPVAVRLYGIDEVLSSSRAFEVLTEFDVADAYATEETAVVVIHTRPSKEAPLTWERVMIFLVPPAMNLVQHLCDCVELSKNKFSANADDDEGVRLTDSGRYLDCARIKSCSAVFFHYAPGVELEFTLRPADVVDKQDFESKQPISHMLHFPMEANDVATELATLVERLGVLPQLDLTRLKLVIYEMVIFRQWISPHMRLFKGGMYDFMQDHDGLHAIFRVDKEVQEKLLEGLSSSPRRKLDVHVYAGRALSATLLALQHLLSLEDVHEKVEQGISAQPEDILKGLRTTLHIRSSECEFHPRLRFSSFAADGDDEDGDVADAEDEAKEAEVSEVMAI